MTDKPTEKWRASGRIDSDNAGMGGASGGVISRPRQNSATRHFAARCISRTHKTTSQQGARYLSRDFSRSKRSFIRLSPVIRYLEPRSLFFKSLPHFLLQSLTSYTLPHIESMLSRQFTKNLFNKRAASTLAADSGLLLSLTSRVADISPSVNAAQDNGRWKGTSTLGGDAKLLIGGSWESSKTDKWSEVLDPSTQHLISKVPHATSAEMKRIVDVAENKFYEWSESSVLTRQRIMLE